MQCDWGVGNVFLGGGSKDVRNDRGVGCRLLVVGRIDLFGVFLFFEYSVIEENCLCMRELHLIRFGIESRLCGTFVLYRGGCFYVFVIRKCNI